MDIVEVARKGGQSRSEKKRAASSRNLAKARAKIRAALDAYKSAPETPQETEPVRPALFAPVLIGRKVE
jgi:hypothetical protein